MRLKKTTTTKYVTFAALEEALVKYISESASEASATGQAVRSDAAFILIGYLSPTPAIRTII